MPGKKATQYPECRIESTDGQTIARAVLNNELGKNSINDFKSFCAKNVQLAAKYGYPDDGNGSRNFRSFVSRIYKRVNAYLRNEKGNYRHPSHPPP